MPMVRVGRGQLAWWLLWAAHAAPWTEENAPWNLNFESRYEPELYYGQWPGHVYNPSPADWRSLVIYQLLTDRFADGDPKNNELHAEGFDVRDMTFRHGGDFEGLRQKLHYIKGLGCNAVWISPIFQNGPNFYHQYAQLDFTLLDKRLGTLEDLRRLVKDAHALGIYVIVNVVMNHMANEFYFQGHSKSVASWRFHEEEGKREYKLKVRQTKAVFYNSSIWCGGEPLWQDFSNEARGLLLYSEGDACEEHCALDPDCNYFLWKNDPGSLSTFHCAGFKYCDSPTPYTDGKASIFKKWTWPLRAVQFAEGVWCGGSGLWSSFGVNASGLLASQDACEAECASNDACEYYLWKDDPMANTRFHCAGFTACEDQSAFGDGVVRIFRKRTVAQRNLDGLYHTPAGRQPYADFWYNNTWVPTAQYNGTVYGQYGESDTDSGFGTYIGSDFHHNGDLQEYYDPWEINLGKIYGVMDDLRLSNDRVQQKYIAMTKALISSTDIDGFRVDTPMQVPLNFYKTWCPAMREHAASVGKHRFGIFGEFFVSVQRYGTMTGRGRDNTMYSQDKFIDDIFTLKGGIVYPYYWYIFTAMVYKRAEFVDGLPLAYAEENKIIDTLDPDTQRHEYAMWTFCNNHDNWRLQSMTGFKEFHMCLAVITFWPGVPLHYAGDEQDFDTPGSALDGWAREELVPSLAWRAVRTQPGGNPADGDNFDMTSGSYLYIKRLNGLRRAYFGGFGNEECDQIQTPSVASPDVLAFIRYCDPHKKVLVFANFHSTQERSAAMNAVPWSAGTVLTDCLNGTVQATVASGTVSVVLAPLQPLVLVAEVETLPPAVVEVWPRHGTSLPPDVAEITMRVRFDKVLAENVANFIKFDNESSSFQCSGSECSWLVAVSSLSDGYHSIEVDGQAMAGDGTVLETMFRSDFLLDRQQGVIANAIHKLPGLICSGGTQLCHKATGATWFRAQNVGGNWSDWRPLEASTPWATDFNVPVLVQYFSHLSASFVVGDCLTDSGQRCDASWHKEMFLRGEFNEWGNQDDGRMQLVDSFTWGKNVTLSGFVRTRFTPVEDWSKSYGSHPVRELLYNVPFFDARHTDFSVVPTLSGSEPCRQWMATRGLWSEQHSVASGAEFATDLWLSHLCTAAAPSCVPDASATWQCHGYTAGQDGAWCASVGTENCTEYAVNDQSEEMSSCSPCYCCRRKVRTAPTGQERTCCVKFNDLFLNYTVTSDLSQCAVRPAPQQVTASFSLRLGAAVPLETYRASVAQALGVEVEVTLVQVSYVVSATYELQLEASQVEAARSEICKAFEVLAESCTVTVLGAGSRRLQAATTRLRMEAETGSEGGVSQLVALADDASAMTSQLQSNAELSSVAVTVAERAVSEMKLVTDVTSQNPMSQSQLVPEPSQVQAALAGSGVTASVSFVTTTTSTTAPSTTASSVASTMASTAGFTSTSETAASASAPGSSSDVGVSLRVRSAGGLDGNFAEFFVDGVRVDLESGRGLSVVILDGSTVLGKHVYDTGYQADGSGPLVELVNSLPTGSLVMVAAMDDASENLTAEAKAALASLGATKVDLIGYRASYALIGVKGGAAIMEEVAASGEGPVSVEILRESGSSTSLAGLASSTSSPGAGSSSMAEPEASTQPATTTEIAWTFEFMDGALGYANAFRNAALLFICMQ